MNSQSILLINGGNFKNDFLEAIVREIIREFNYSVQIIESAIDLNEYYDATRRQFDGNKLLKAIQTTTAPDIIKTIGLYKVDLYIPILTYIFGQAILHGNYGIASVYRLRNELYGLDKDDALLRHRFTKVIIHELGHAFGLIHCNAPTCIMQPSTYVEDIDQKKVVFA